jgi:hypothetical protein
MIPNLDRGANQRSIRLAVCDVGSLSLRPLCSRKQGVRREEAILEELREIRKRLDRLEKPKNI